VTVGQRGALVLAVGLLVAAISLQFFFRWREPPQPVRSARLAEAVIRSMAGWRISDELLGPTEGVSKSMLKTLNLDDYVFRRYQRGVVQFTVYAAYWAPGQMPTRLVASHTPDRCWTESGMRCVDMRFRQRLELEGRALLPAEVRTFTPPAGDERTHVIYWHTVEGRIYDYGARFNAVPDPWLWWKDTLAQAAFGSREQLFVRIASPLSIEALWRDPGFQRVLASLAALGLHETGSENL
jgi:hypothetical protein